MSEGDFRTNDQTMMLDAIKREKLELGPNDVVAFVSLAHNQILFVWRPLEIDVSAYGHRRGNATVFRSQRLRLSNSTWEPTMLANYAADVGLQLDGLRRFEDIQELAAKRKAGT